MRILGVDPGLRITGFGVVDAAASDLRYVASGVIRPPETGSLPARLKAIHDGIAEVMREYRPEAGAVEIVFVNVNPKSTLLLGQARGAAITTMAAAGLDVHEYAALQIKQAVTGTGRAAKSQVQAMVQRLLRLPGTPSPDAADALACAICHAHAAALAGAVALQRPAALAAAGARSGTRMRRGRLR